MPEEAKTLSRERLLTRFKYVDEQLEGKSYLMGDTFSVADAYLFTVTSWGKHVGVDIWALPEPSGLHGPHRGAPRRAGRAEGRRSDQVSAGWRRDSTHSSFSGWAGGRRPQPRRRARSSDRRGSRSWRALAGGALGIGRSSRPHTASSLLLQPRHHARPARQPCSSLPAWCPRAAASARCVRRTRPCPAPASSNSCAPRFLDARLVGCGASSISALT